MYPSPDDYDVSVRDRVYGRATTSSEGRRSIAVVLLAVSVFALITSLSCRQATEPHAATNLLQAGIVTLTDIDQMLVDDGPALRESVQQSEDAIVSIPGYPLDLAFTREEILQSTDSELRELILERSAAQVYADGVDAFDRTGEQSLRRFSIQGVLELGVGQLSESNFDRATFLALVSALGCTVFGAIAAATGSGWGRMRSVGMAAAAGALPGIVIFFLLRLVVGQIGDGDPFVASYRDITNAVLGVPLRNSIIVFSAGAVVVAASIVLARLERMTSPPPAAFADDDY